MAAPWTQILRKIDDWRWEIPATYKPGMRVPGLIYADEKMLRLMGEDQAIEQVANVATLPGIVGRSLAMPDIHWGYGFPVGGVAAFDVAEGVISPGGVGYDINCLTGDARVLHEFGYQRPIAAFREGWDRERIKCLSPRHAVRNTGIVRFICRPTPAQVFRLVTESGREVVATADHPFFTPQGMTPLRDLAEGDRVAVYPFEGVPFEAPDDAVLVSEADVRRVYTGPATGLAQVLRVLRDRDLLPLRLNHPRLPYLVKLMGFVQGDGSLHVGGRGGSLLAFYGDPEDLEAIRADVLRLGFIPSRVYQRHRAHTIATRYGRFDFEQTESAVQVRATALAVLLRCLGTPAGNKSTQDVDAPGWLGAAPLWLKRLYLAALFGAELTAPVASRVHAYNFPGPVLSLNKRTSCVASGRRFLAVIQAWLHELGVESALLRERAECRNKDGTWSTRLRLQVSGRPDNLIRLWTWVGFEYNRRKQALGCVAAQYLRLKSLVIDERTASIRRVRALQSVAMRPDDIVAIVGSRHANRRFVERSLWEPRTSGVPVGTAFPGFWTYLTEQTCELGETGQVWETIRVKQVVRHDEAVYDFTVDDPHHNFIANGFVISNCGVRLLRTDLMESDVRPRLTELVDTLFRTVPSGVGVGGHVKVSLNEIDAVLSGGARWAVSKGYGHAGDLEVIEAGGALARADPDAVYTEAKKRGRGQIGTLGSGNHFLEVQIVDQIFDAAAAAAMGLLNAGQVVVFIHSGSRGLGHQVCTDYLRVCERVAARHRIHLVDRQLACVPLTSDEGQQYFGAMCAAANFAWANRQLITHWARASFEQVFGGAWERLGIQVVYDVAHNIAKIEEYEVGGSRRSLCVHRKGATRAFPAGHAEVPARYRASGQPVFVPGDMGRYSFVAVGAEGAMRESFGSTCHGAGRMLGRKAAVRALAGRDIGDELRRKGIVVRAQDRSLLAEEASDAYKDVADVVGICHAAGLSRRVAKMRPIGVIKG
jgi:tRNA-splicing ligase RtcB